MWSTALRLSLHLRRPISLCRPVLCPVLHPAEGRLCVTRGYSSDKPPKRQEQETVIVGLPEPFTWLRAKLAFFFIRNLLDQDFDYDEFSRGASQAISFVSRQLSQCKFDALEDVVEEEVLTELKEKCSAMSDNYRKALEVGIDDILSLTPKDVQFYKDNGRRFVNILMYFWYTKSMHLLAERKSKPLLQIVYGNYNIDQSQRILIATYGFTREFTQGAKPEWIITDVRHSTILE